MAKSKPGKQAPSTHVGRTLSEADALGHEATDLRPSLEHLGVQFAAAPQPGTICWMGLCGDPEPGFRLVKYTDSDGLCNVYRKVRC